MNIALIKGPANITGEDLRQLLLSAFGGSYDPDADVYSDHNPNIMIPASGQAPGTQAATGAQICQIMSWWTQSQLEALLADHNLNQYNVVGLQTFEEFLIPDSDPPEYAPIVSTPISQGTLQYLTPRGQQTADYNWFPNYAGSSVWVGL